MSVRIVLNWLQKNNAAKSLRELYCTLLSLKFLLFPKAFYSLIKHLQFFIRETADALLIVERTNPELVQIRDFHIYYDLVKQTHLLSDVHQSFNWPFLGKAHLDEGFVEKMAKTRKILSPKSVSLVNAVELLKALQEALHIIFL